MIHSAVVSPGPGLAFIAYPQAVAMMPLPQLWSICFFIMLLLLGLDTQVRHTHGRRNKSIWTCSFLSCLMSLQFVAMEVVMTSIIDMFPVVMRKAGRRERFLLVFCLTCFFCQLIMITEVSTCIHIYNSIMTVSGCQNVAISMSWICLIILSSVDTF